jgi:hypothetical protein
MAAITAQSQETLSNVRSSLPVACAESLAWVYGAWCLAAGQLLDPFEALRLGFIVSLLSMFPPLLFLTCASTAIGMAAVLHRPAPVKWFAMMAACQWIAARIVLIAPSF